MPSLRLRTQPATPVANAACTARIAITHALHAAVDDERGARNDRVIASRRRHANSAAIVLPSVKPPQS